VVWGVNVFSNLAPKWEVGDEDSPIDDSSVKHDGQDGNRLSLIMDCNKFYGSINTQSITNQKDPIRQPSS